MASEHQMTLKTHGAGYIMTFDI